MPSRFSLGDTKLQWLYIPIALYTVGEIRRLLPSPSKRDDHIAKAAAKDAHASIIKYHDALLFTLVAFNIGMVALSGFFSRGLGQWQIIWLSLLAFNTAINLTLKRRRIEQLIAIGPDGEMPSHPYWYTALSVAVNISILTMGGFYLPYGD